MATTRKLKIQWNIIFNNYLLKLNTSQIQHLSDKLQKSLNHILKIIKVKEEEFKLLESNVKNETELAPRSKQITETTSKNFKYPIHVKENILKLSSSDDGGQLPIWISTQRSQISKNSIDSRTRYLLTLLGEQESDDGQQRQLKTFLKHLRAYPQARSAAIKSRGIAQILHIYNKTINSYVKDEAREVLTLLGHISPVSGRGIRILTIDGGGIRGLVSLQILKVLEAKTGLPIYRLFDYVCGVSTGAIIAVLIALRRLPLDVCEKLYTQLGTEIFSRTTLQGATGLFMKNSYYDSDAWKNMLENNMGTELLISTSKSQDAPKVGLVCTLASSTETKVFVFRNYQLPYRVASHFQGSCMAQVWEGVRASAAAPGYFSEFKLGNNILLDGGLLVNNPSAIALHEAKILWPDTDIQCIISLGNGRHDTLGSVNETSFNWSSKIRTILNSATDTEGVHTILHDLLPGSVYYRFNPYLSELTAIDETAPEKISTILEDTELYIRKNETKIDAAVQSLTKEKTFFSKCYNWYKLQKTIWW